MSLVFNPFTKKLDYIGLPGGASAVTSITATAPLTANGFSGTPESGTVTLALTTPLSGANGGTGVANTGLTINLGSGSAGKVLTSDSSGNGTWQAAGGGGITTLNGDAGSATGSTILVTALGSLSGFNCGSSVSFTGSGSTMELDLTDAQQNIFLGRSAGKVNSVATGCVAVGVLALGSVSTTSGAPTGNVAIGAVALNASVIGVQNTAVGAGAMQSSLGDGNTTIGYQSLYSLVGAGGATDGNTAMGFGAGYGVINGTYNNFFGYQSGSNYGGSESSNILIGNPGVASENHAIHIGTQGSADGQQNACFIAGIAGVTVSNTNMVTIDTTTGQLGAQALPVSGPGSSTDRAIATWNGTGGTALFDNSTTKIDSTGRQTNSAQPAFRASLTGTQSNVTGDGTSFDIVFDNPTLNQGSSYNGSNGIFTTPIDGAYLFIVTVAFSGLGVAHTNLLVTLFSGGNPYYLTQLNPSTSNTSGNMIFSGSFIVNSIATSTTYVEVVVVGGTKVVGVTGAGAGNYSNFSGCLIC